jgi:hypothetical protein
VVVSSSYESGEWFRSLLFVLPVCEEVLRASPGCGRSVAEDLPTQVQVQDENPNQDAEVQAHSPSMFLLLDKNKTTDKVRLNRFNLKNSRVPTHEECL